ncbi:LUD domain-containing protein [Megasphaera paucivorans]|uniref:Iron-sulfur cluster-binding protein n=1 Tax=Megasphaera paucivorans TaxID=349095 RepID=A0A1G9V744_9FIRM|nr:LUD domain-containing protein [Megasphaera paucivorans]SDM67920.1 iron-sulfur cluster-binding protein [Megasphaera paucivorans]
MDNEELKQEIESAIENNALQNALTKFTSAYPGNRAKVYKGYDFEAIREKIHEGKSYAAEHIHELVDEFEKNFNARGGHVFRAADGEAAMEYIRKLAKEKGVKAIVKSKSMTTEEIHMNELLREDGIDVQETDLGEFINAITGDTPVHMVMPAIHLSKEQVAEYFTEYLHEQNNPVILELVRSSRKYMRDKFLNADMGVSGANIAVANTGTVITFTNEGNGRMTATLPPIHVYVVGIEKFVAKLSDIRYAMKALPRNGTAQTLTSYVCMYTGSNEVVVNKETDEKAQKEFHVVILDNGRSKILEDPDFKDIFCCIRCGACLNVCSAFRLVGGHVYGGKVYTGGIGTLLTAFLTSQERAENIQNLCLQCKKCNEVCAGKLDIAGMILKLRTRYAKRDGLNPIHKFALDTVSDRHLFHSMLRIASVAQGALSKGEPMIRHMPMFLSGLTAGRSLPTVAKVPFRDVILTMKQDVPNPKGTIGIFTGCLLDFVYVDIAEAVVKGLNACGYKVEMPQGQSCCGAPATYMGDEDNAKKSAVINIEAMEAEKYDYIVSACPTCTHALIDYQNMFQDDPEMLKRAKILAEKTFDFSKLVYMLGGIPGDGDGVPMKITYHDSCHMRRTMNVWKEQRELLTQTQGVELTEMTECDSCCGFSGSYSIKYPEISAPILQAKINHILETGADTVAVDCPGCLLQIRGGLDARGRDDIKVKHTAQILTEKRGL